MRRMTMTFTLPTAQFQPCFANFTADRTIDSPIKRMRYKFKAVDDAFDMIDTLYGVGYRFREV